MLLLRKIFAFVLRVLLAILLFSIFWVWTYRFINPPITPFMLVKYFQADTENSLNKEWKKLEDISPNLPLAVIAAEDQLFFEHNGFDVQAIKEAVEHNKTSSRKRGASTISQQTAKNVFLIPTRSYLRKGFEVYFTFLIEFFWSKHRILEVYLNVIEQGENIYGVEASAKRYFNRSAKEVNASQAALMATVLPNPVKFRISSPSNYVLNRKAWILKQMNNLGGTAFVEELYED